MTILSVAGLSALAGPAAAAECAIGLRRLVDTSSYGVTSAGEPCRGYFYARRGPMSFRRLYLASPPKHGAVRLQEGGYFIYTPANGFTGSDTFQLRVCGTRGQTDDCANINYSIEVRPR